MDEMTSKAVDEHGVQHSDPDVIIPRLSYEQSRGCGFRKAGGIYLVSNPEEWKPCGKLPWPVGCCPTCNQGIKQSRGVAWVNPRGLFEDTICQDPDINCPIEYPHGKMPLLWVGKQFYPYPWDFVDEATTQGVSRRVRAVPKGLKPGDPILLAHPKACGENEAGIFGIFRPDRFEYVVKGKETQEELQAIVDRGLTPVNVIPISVGGAG